MVCGSLMIMRTSINFEAGASFDTLVYNTLGPTWNVANGILFAFLLYILDYAYISGGGAICLQDARWQLSPSRPRGSLECPGQAFAQAKGAAVARAGGGRWAYVAR